jgi:hypothetical protein
LCALAHRYIGTEKQGAYEQASVGDRWEEIVNLLYAVKKIYLKSLKYFNIERFHVFSNGGIRGNLISLFTGCGNRNS